MPLGESMLSTLRSNKNIMLDKSKHFRKTSRGYSEKLKTAYDFPEATPDLLAEIRNKIKTENTKIRIKIILIFFILIIMMFVSYLLI